MELNLWPNLTFIRSYLELLGFVRQYGGSNNNALTHLRMLVLSSKPLDGLTGSKTELP